MEGQSPPRHFHSAQVNKVPFWDRTIGALGLGRIRGFQVGEILCSMPPTCKLRPQSEAATGEGNQRCPGFCGGAPTAPRTTQVRTADVGGRRLCPQSWPGLGGEGLLSFLSDNLIGYFSLLGLFSILGYSRRAAHVWIWPTYISKKTCLVRCGSRGPPSSFLGVGWGPLP